MTSPPATDHAGNSGPVMASSASPRDRSEELEREVRLLSELLIEERRRGEAHALLATWFVRMHECILAQPRWWAWLPPSQRRSRQLRRLRRAGLFDSTHYLARYADVRDAGMDPLDHYLRHGVHEARSAIPAPDEAPHG